MPLMSIIKYTIQVAKREITLFLINTLIIILVYNLYLNEIIIFYPLLLSIAIMVVYLVFKAIALNSFYKQLERAKTTVENYYYDDNLEANVLKTISMIHQKYINQITKLQSKMNNRNELFTQLTHGQKSSVAVIELALNKLDFDRLENTPFSDIYAENEKLKKNLEQSLNILRLDAFENDYVPKRVNLAELVTNSINEHKRDFIYASIYPKLNGSAFVYTDEKWCIFIISQLISNAIKYSSANNNIIFDIETFENRTELRIMDNGIGIPTNDLPRVFDMYFTGENGRKSKESTGIGLFMVKLIANKLGIIISINSEVGKGTTVVLTFRNLTRM